MERDKERAAKHEGKGFVVNREQCHHYTITGGECSTHTHSYDYILLQNQLNLFCFVYPYDDDEDYTAARVCE